MNSPYLVLAAPGAPRFPLVLDEVTIGRASDNVMPIDHPELSRHHARFVRQGADLYLEDLNSRNGTFVNGRRLAQPVKLNDLDRIEFASITMVFHTAEKPLGAAPSLVPPPAGGPFPVGNAPQGPWSDMPAAGGPPPGLPPGGQPMMAGPGRAPVPPTGSTGPIQGGPPPRPVASGPPPVRREAPAGAAPPMGGPSPSAQPSAAPRAALEGGEQPILLVKDDTIFGRVPGNDIVLADPEISARHAMIRFADGEFVLYDLGSTNGTFVNGRRIAGPTPIQPGDEIRMGQIQLFFRRLTPATVKRPPARGPAGPPPGGPPRSGPPGGPPSGPPPGGPPGGRPPR